MIHHKLKLTRALDWSMLSAAITASIISTSLEHVLVIHVAFSGRLDVHIGAAFMKITHIITRKDVGVSRL